VTESTPDPAVEAGIEEITEELTEAEREEIRQIEQRTRERQEHQKRNPRVIVTIRSVVDTREASWSDPPGEDDAGLVAHEDGIWNARYRVRGGDRTITARHMGFPFEYRAADYKLYQGDAGDWLIREDDTGYVFALTAHALEHLFEPVEQEPEQVLASEP
jgi:hypothetical protein